MTVRVRVRVRTRARDWVSFFFFSVCKVTKTFVLLS